MDMAKQCVFCVFRAPSLGLWLSHVRSVHADDSDFEMECCGTTYTKCSSFVSHVYRKHRDQLLSGANVRTVPLPAIQNTDDTDAGPSFELAESAMDYFESETGDESLQHVVDQLLQLDEEEQKKHSALFLLRLKEKRCLSQAALGDIVVSCKSLFNHTIGRVQAGVKERLASSGLHSAEIPGLDDFLETIQDPFEGLHSTYLQEKFYNEKLGCIVPEEIHVGRAKYVTQFSGSKRKKVLKSDSFYYVPLEALLKQLLQHPEIFAQVNNPSHSEDGILRDYCDGQVFKKHSLFMADNRALQIIAYFDEVELCNPLGSAAKVHKVGCIFITLGNMRPRFRSSLKAIFLVAISPSPVIVKHGIDEFLRPFVDDLKRLNNSGLNVSVGGTAHSFRVGLMVFLADTLAAHQLGGFKESMSFALRICRTCLATTKQSQIHFIESEFELRSPEKHEQHCELLKGALGNHYSVSFGVNRQSVLDSVKDFSVVQNLPHDTMHDLLEGTLPHELKAFLKFVCVESKFFTLAVFNDRLSNFDYGYTEKSDKPIEIDEKVFKKPDAKIRQSAAQMWNLASVMPFLVADILPPECQHWKCFLLLLKICKICTSWQVSHDMVDYLRVLIEEHHTMFKSLYPETSLIPKMHYMVHYPSQMLAFGPLTNSWTMRYEAKLSVIKRAARHGNFKNICLTVAKRHQHLLCYYLNSEDNLLGVETSGSSRQVSSLEIETNELQLCVQQHLGQSVNGESRVFRPTWVKTGGMHLQKNVFVLVGTGTLYPNFGKIIDLFVVGSSVFVCILSCTTLAFESNYNSFIISTGRTTGYFNISQLPLFPVLHARRSFDKTDKNVYLSPKQHIIVS